MVAKAAPDDKTCQRCKSNPVEVEAETFDGDLIEACLRCWYATVEPRAGDIKSMDVTLRPGRLR